ncbi:substrate-binding periplasmic protein [Paraburkholderia acidiphila]|uniref:Transporter substrate-binding domain-containing protein n=1 Tax=Paraburkholderia acidiphila TaxID=2571747 RepID=A0A7Z2G7B7_9BURK|nr:transporter substrate-binding domain-containing protein [Paraburkholderia acidiphila]QGZ56411.1 transporter substrate-binding domain-containing protein [Paraburkholderia acidiphila]
MRRTGNLVKFAFASVYLSIAMNVSLASAGECTPKHALKTITPGTLTIVTQLFPPFDVLDGDHSLAGVEGDILMPFAKQECLKVVTVVVDGSSAIQYILTGRGDIAAASWFRTAARAKVVGISDPLYLDQMAIYSKDGLTRVSQLEGKSVGSVQGYNWVGDLQKVLGDNLKLYPNPVALANDLAAGRVSIGVDSYGTGLFAQKKGGYAGLQIKVSEPDQRVRATVNSAQIGFLYSKDNEDLGKALNEYIQNMHLSGAIKRIFTEHGLDPQGAVPGPSRLIQ